MINDVLRTMLGAFAREYLGVSGQSLAEQLFDRITATSTSYRMLPESVCKACRVPNYVDDMGNILCLQCGMVYGWMPTQNNRHATTNTAWDWSQSQQEYPRRRQHRVVSQDDNTAYLLAKAYRTLKLRPTATVNDVKTARRKMALQYHSDITGGSDKKMAEINAAADLILSNKVKTNG